MLFFSPWYVAQLVLFPATALQLLPLTQQKVQNEPCQCRQKKSSAEKEVAMGERNTEQQEAGGLGSSRKLQKHGAVCCALQLSRELPEGRRILHRGTNGSHRDIAVFSVCIVKVRMELYGYKNPSPAQKVALQNLFLFPTGLKPTNHMCILTCSL